LSHIASLSYFIAEAQGNRVVRREQSSMMQTRSQVIYPWTGWSRSKDRRRPEPV